MFQSGSKLFKSSPNAVISLTGPTDAGRLPSLSQWPIRCQPLSSA